MNTQTVFIALGSNEGDRLDYCDRALALMRLLPHSKVTGVSSYYETEPVGLEQAPHTLWFYNGVVRIETQLQLEHLFAICQETERSLGKENGRTNRPRTIDLDILFYGQQIIRTPHLTIPHPRLHHRRFVLEPLAEIDPDWIHPYIGQPIRLLLDHVTDTHQVRKLDVTPGSHYHTVTSCSPPFTS